MKKNTLFGLVTTAIMVLGSCSTYAGEKAADKMNVKVFGEARAFLEATNKSNTDSEIKSTDSKLGVKFNGKANDNLSVFGELSANIDVNGDGADDLTTRFGYVGVGTPFGNISIGKQMSIMETYVDKADIFYNGGNLGVQKQGFYQKNSLKYTNNIGPFSVGALGVFTDDAADKTIDSFQLGAGIDGAGLIPNIGVAYARNEITDINHYGIGADKKIGKLLLAGSLSMKDAATDVIGYELATGFDLTKALTLKAGWSDTDAANDDGTITGGGEFKIGNQAVAFSTVDYDIDGSDYTIRTGLSIQF